jgi:NADH dehydrogenase
MDAPHRVVVVGGGFGGLQVAHCLRHPSVSVTLVDRRNYYLFQPLLYQVATGALSPANIAAPLRSLLRRRKNVQVLLASATGIDVTGKLLILEDGSLPYDTLVLATGARNHYFGHPEWAERAPALKTIEDATDIRRRILLAFEVAERETDSERRRGWLTFVVVGGGPTGVELAGQIGELAHHTLRHEFRTCRTTDATILLIEGADRILGTFPPALSAKAVHSLAKLGVSVRTNATVTDIQHDTITVKHGEETLHIAAHTVLWAAGVQASPLGKKLADATGVPLDRCGRVMVQPDLTIPGHPEIFVIGDLANFSHVGGRPLPGVAPVAMQQGRYVADAINGRLLGKPVAPFHYRDRGNLATIGRNSAVADLGWITFSGYFAWLAWLSIHILYLAQFQNRLLVVLQWAWSYLTRNRSACLITGEHPYPHLPESELPEAARAKGGQ